MAKRIAKPAAKASPRGKTSARSVSKRPSPSVLEPRTRVPFTHTEKVIFPEAGLTKEDVLRFYQQIAPVLLPHLHDRPVTLERLPGGLAPGAPRFWQKNTPDHYPSWIPRIELPSEHGKAVRYALVNDADTLLYLVNQGALTFHVWPSRVENLDVPDYVLFDLDPGKSAFAAVVKIAKRMREVLTAAGRDPLVKTSGKSGLHILVAWGEKSDYDAARQWAMQIARQLVGDLPDLATTERLKSERHGHVYVDVIQNARGHHAVPPYVLRAVPQATVSTPLEWKELTPRLSPRKFTTEVVLKRVRKLGDLMASLAGPSRTAR